MLKKIPALLNGDLLKTLCDMGHGDQIILADAHFPVMSQNVPVIRYDGVNIADLLEAILPYFPLDQYVEESIFYMQMVEAPDKLPKICNLYQDILNKNEYHAPMTSLERHAFYAQAKKAYAIIATGDTRQYANLILQKGVCTLENTKISL